MPGFSDAVETERVKATFSRSGLDPIHVNPFRTRTIETDVDVLGMYRNVLVLVECAGTEPFGTKLRATITKFRALEEDMDQLIRIVRQRHRTFYARHQAELTSPRLITRRLLVCFNAQTRGELSSQQRTLARGENVKIWTFEECIYHERVAECTFDHCKYEILESLSVRPHEIDEPGGRQSFLAYGEVANGLTVLNLLLPVNVVLTRSNIKRLRDSSELRGYQRLLNKQKLSRMRDFLLQRRFPGYPNSIICVLNGAHPLRIGPRVSETANLAEEHQNMLGDFRRDTREHLFMLDLPNSYDVFEIIDGQHRVFSYAQTKYSKYASGKTPTEKAALRRGDEQMEQLAAISTIQVTALHARDRRLIDPSSLFYQVNTTQTRIRSIDVIDLIERFNPNSPLAQANKLLVRLNESGILKDKISVKFWQSDRIKRSSLIAYSGLSDVFNDGKNNPTNQIFRQAFERQRERGIDNYIGFNTILVNNFLWSLADLIRARDARAYARIEQDMTLNNYYLFSAVFVGSLIRLLRHFVSSRNREFDTTRSIAPLLVQGRTPRETVKLNISNQRIKQQFDEGLGPIANTLNFTKNEFRARGWGANSWARIEAVLFYLIRDDGHPAFGEEGLIPPKNRPGAPAP